ncbi:MAG: hypothetical protein N2112_07230 [Gemmataceae bacterium]|nr:hypothetical protein [Gemmataceae bacterium]
MLSLRIFLASASLGFSVLTGCQTPLTVSQDTHSHTTSSPNISKYPDAEPRVVRGQMYPATKSTNSDKFAGPTADTKQQKLPQGLAKADSELVYDEQVKPATLSDRMGASKPTAITSGGVSPGECKVIPAAGQFGVPAHAGITGSRTAGKFEWDPHSRSMPTATGLYLNQGPYDSPFERAVELGLRVQSLEGENAELRNKIRQLEQLVENRERLLREDETELRNAAEDVVRARAELEAVRKDFAKLKARLRQVEKEDLETLRSIVTALEKLLERLPQ